MLAESTLLEFLEQPTHLVFVAPLLLGLALFLIQMVGFGLSEAGEHDVDHDVDADHDVDVDHDVDHDHDVDADHDGGFGVGDALRFLNVGRVPFMAVLQAVLLGFGLAGLAASYAVAGRLPANVPVLAATLPLATILGLLFAKVLTGVIAKAAPTIETKENKLARLLGEEVQVESAQVDDKQGRAFWKDADGQLITVYVRTAPGAPVLSKGAKARLERFDSKDKTFVCVGADGKGN